MILAREMSEVVAKRCLIVMQCLRWVREGLQGLDRRPGLVRILAFLGVGVLLVASGVCAATGESGAAWREGGQWPRTVLAAGDHVRQLDHGGWGRRYLLHLPAGYMPGHPLPLVVALHGGGGHAEFMADYTRYGLSQVADQEGFIVVYPNGFSRFPRGRLATWNAGQCCGEARDRGIDDVGFIRAVVAEVGREVAVDPRRIFAAGMSNGGMLSHRLACDAADLFRAVASVAGTDATATCAPVRPVSLLHIHARDDTHVLYHGGAGPDAFRDPAKVMDFVSVPESVARWVTRNQCVTPGGRQAFAGGYCERFGGCRDGVVVQLCVTETGGHSWPGAQRTRRAKAPASQAFDASQAIWNFFRAVSRLPGAE